MHQDVGELRDFYARPLGIAVRRLLSHRLRARWRNVRDETIIGLGYAPPFLGPFREEAYRIGAIMPAAQGALVWPLKDANKLAVLADEDQLPLSDNSVDKLVVAHCLENTERVKPLLREIWRVLAPEGRVMLIVPNRRSIWARSDKTPFGHGRPYSRHQLDRLLTEAMFTITGWQYALHAPPIEHNLVLRSVTGLERLGASMWPGIGGVIMVEGKKELHSPTGRLRTAPALGKLVTIAQPQRSASPADKREAAARGSCQH